MDDNELEQKHDRLVNELKVGNRAAAAELVDMYYKQIYVFMRRLGHTRQVSEDLTQESFLQAWRYIHQLRQGRALVSWLYRIASNASKLYWRRQNIRRTVNIEELELQECADGEHCKVERRDELEHLGKAVGRLPLKLRQSIVLHYMEHLTIAESARAADVGEGTFKSRLSRALSALRNEISSKD